MAIAVAYRLLQEEYGIERNHNVGGNGRSFYNGHPWSDRRFLISISAQAVVPRSPPAPVTVIDARDSDGISSLACSDVRLVRRISQLSQVLAQQVRDDHSEEVSYKQTVKALTLIFCMQAIK